MFKNKTQNTLLLHYFHMKIPLYLGPLDFKWSIHLHVEYMQNTNNFITHIEVSMPVPQST